MTDKQIIIDGIDVADCEHLNSCNKKMKCVILQDDICETNPYCEGFNCYYKQLKRAEQRIVELNKTIQAKEQECEKLDKELRKDFEEKNTLHLIIDRLLEASGYDTNTASPEDFEDVYENIRYEKQQLDQLKAENENLKQYKASKQASYESMQRKWNQAVNANKELKAENKHLNDLLNQSLKELEELQNLKDEDSLRVVILARENERLKELLAQDRCFQDKSHKCVKSFYIDERYKQTIEKIKEFCITYSDNHDCYETVYKYILQMCDEVNNGR